mmetsp:Transcript_18388/g.24273  ORF Transcript_18388/g.24273 Transcript_18388/m.24273 type:complete len:113 (-) Transcript_18388:1337-1675(-)
MCSSFSKEVRCWWCKITVKQIAAAEYINKSRKEHRRNIWRLLSYIVISQNDNVGLKAKNYFTRFEFASASSCSHLFCACSNFLLRSSSRRKYSVEHLSYKLISYSMYIFKTF